MGTTRDRPKPLRAAGNTLRGGRGHDGMQTLAAIGLIARGLVYGVIGLLAFKVAIGAGGKTTSQSGAMHTIATQPFGKLLLIALAIGLAAYAIWRLIDGVAGGRPDDEGALQRRVSALGSAVGYAVLCVTAVKVLAGAHTSNGSPRPAAAGILGWPAGPVLVAIGGLVVIGIGVYQGYKGIARTFLDDSRTERMGEGTETAFISLGVVGHVARAVTFLLIGYGLVKAALDYSPKSAVGLDGALQKLAHASTGPVLLGVVALGFMAFALYSIADARYHRV